MKFKIYLILLFLAWCGFSFGQSVKVSEEELKEELRECLGKTGCTYYAYPGPLQKVYTPVPEGFKPVYLSHYGRHGSRLLTSDARYQEVLEIFDAHELTDFGKNVRQRLEIVWTQAKGCGGDLTPVGERQHYQIAQRMAHNYPSLFEGKAQIQAVASTAKRCMMSMMAFCEGLKELYPTLQITRSAHEREMAYIDYKLPELKKASSDDGEIWTNLVNPYIHETVHPERIMRAIFKDVVKEEDAYKLFDGLYFIANDMQDTELGNLSFFDLFTFEELYAYFKCQNYKNYLNYGPSKEYGTLTAGSAESLLKQIVMDADAALARDRCQVNLRFGHDSALMRLLTRMKVKECDAVDTDRDKLGTEWQCFRIIPMAANLQMVFFKNEEKKVLVKFLLNENEVSLPIEAENGCYYEWEKVKQLWNLQ